MEDNKILKAIRAFPSGDIYLMAPKQYVTRGFDYYRKSATKGFKWSPDMNALNAQVKGSEYYEVVFFLINGGLRFTCNCPAWTNGNQCKHVICATMTTKNLLNSNHFNEPTINRDERELLRKSLFNEKETVQDKVVYINEKPVETILPENYAIVIKADTGYYFSPMSLLKNGKELPRFTTKVPKELQPFMDYGYYYTYEEKKDKFLRYLKKFGNKHPLFIDVEGDLIPLKWDSGIKYESQVELNVVKNDVFISLFYLKNEVQVESTLQFSDRMLIDIGSREIGILKDFEANRFFNSMQDTFSSMSDNNEEEYDDDEYSDYIDENEDENEISIPLKQYQSFQLFMREKENSLLDKLNFKVEGKQVSLEEDNFSYGIVVDEHPFMQDNMRLKMLCRLEDEDYSTSIRFFKFFLNLNREMSPLATPLLAKKRRKKMAEAFFEFSSLKTKKEAHSLISSSIEDMEIKQRDVRSEVRDCLKQAFDQLKNISSRIQFHNDKWMILKNNIDKELPLYSIPMELFGSSAFLDMNSHNEMTIDADLLYYILPTLYEYLLEEGIPLFFKGKRVSHSKWEFNLDVSSASNIDWFEVKPEIRRDNILMNNSFLDKTLAGKGVIEDEDYVQIVDSNTQRILNTIAGISRQTSKLDDKEKTIVQVPRLQILDWIELKKCGVNISLSQSDEAFIEKLSNFKKIEKKSLPKGLQATMRPYQEEGYHWLAFLYEYRFGACLADDMGLGKTLQAITLLAALKEKIVTSHNHETSSPHLIVLPPSLLFNWQSEIEKFYPTLKTVCYGGVNRNIDFGNADVVLTTYGIIRRDIEKLEKLFFNVIIFDEAQAVKNLYAATTGAVRRLKGYFKLAITGTPMENHLGEYYSILDLALPGLLGEYEDFKPMMKLGKSDDLDVILKRTRPFVMRRTKEKILKELPEKTESNIYLELTDKQSTFYQKTVDMLKNKINKAYKDKSEAQARIIALTALMRLRQLCVSPRLLDPSITEKSPKMDFISMKISELLDEGHSALVFSQFTSFLDLVEEELNSQKIDFLRLDGSTPIAKRKKLVETFQNGDGPKVFLLSLKAGGQGLNLTQASYVFHLDPWWNPAVENQASDRVHRIGQKNKVTITRILMRHTIEEKMMTLKEKKLALFKAIMEDDSSRKGGYAITKDDINFLIG